MPTDRRAQVTPPLVPIGAFRVAMKETLAEAAQRITDAGYPISKSGLGNIETGVRGPSQEFLEAWSRAYGVRDELVVDRAPRRSGKAA